MQENPNPKLGFKSAIITFANKEFELAFFKKDNTNFKDLYTNSKTLQEDIISAGSLDIDRMKRDFTINAVVQYSFSNYIDFIYKFNRKKISAKADIYNGIIRCIGTPSKRFQEDPIRILRMFRFQSQLGYSINEETWNGAIESKNLLTTLSFDEIKDEFNKIITGKFVILALTNMQKFGFFNLNFNGYEFFSLLNNIEQESLEQLEEFNRRLTYIDDNTKTSKITVDLTEAYILLLSAFPANQIRFHLETLKFLDTIEIERVIWIIEHQELFNIEDLHYKIYNIKNDGYLGKNNRIELLNLMRHIKHIIATLNSEEEGKAIYDVFCFRPYFAEQLRVTTNDIIQYTNNVFDKNDSIIDDIKEAIIKRLLEVDGLQWPYEYKDYMQYVKQGINDVCPEIKVNIPDWPGLIDDYGNWMIHHKAIQHFRVPFSITKLSDLGIEKFEDLEDILYSKDENIKKQFNNLLKEFKEKDKTLKRI